MAVGIPEVARVDAPRTVVRRIGDGRTGLLRPREHGIDAGPAADEVAKTELAAARSTSAGMVTAAHSAWIGASGSDQYIAAPYPSSSRTVRGRWEPVHTSTLYALGRIACGALVVVLAIGIALGWWFGVMR